MTVSVLVRRPGSTTWKRTAQGKRGRDQGIGVLVHPVGLGRPSPLDEPVVLAQPAAPSEIDVPSLMQAGAHVDLAAKEQGDHHERAVEAVGHEDVACLERVQQAAQEGRFAGLLARIGTGGQVQDRGGGQRKDRAGASNRESDALLLRSRRGIFASIGLRVGHGEREAIDQLGVVSLPQPSGIGSLLQFLGGLDGQFLQGRFGELGPRGSSRPCRRSGRGVPSTPDRWRCSPRRTGRRLPCRRAGPVPRRPTGSPPWNRHRTCQTSRRAWQRSSGCVPPPAPRRKAVLAGPRPRRSIVENWYGRRAENLLW